MKRSLCQYLACPRCGGDLALDARTTEGVEVMEGVLTATCCGATFPITRGVPRFVEVGSLGEGKDETAQSFGWQWKHFDEQIDLYESEFLGWVAPVQRDFFAGKVVLEAGCGKGRHTLLSARWGAKDHLAVDLSEAVDPAFDATRGMPNAHVIQADIYALPVKRCADYAFAVGVLHHVPEPRAAFRALASKVKPGGHISAWIYGKENNAWIYNVVSPVREKVTSRLDRRALLQLSKIPAAALFAATKLVYGPVNAGPLKEKLAPRLWYNDYLAFLSRFGFREQHSIVFDHLCAPTAFYIPREEFEAWWKDIGATDVVIGWHNRNSWRGFGKVPEGRPSIEAEASASPRVDAKR